jgi:hypothetical protein
MRVRLSRFLFSLLATGGCAFGQAIHYLDCSAGSDAADSLTPRTAWRSVAKASAFTYQPGDSLLLKRGARCEGMLWPKGSGTEQTPIHIAAYGQGALPIIVGGGESAGLRLNNQQYWEIEDLEVVGGSPYGIHIGGSAPEMRHFRITNVVVHDVTGTPLTKDSGLLVIAPDDNAKSRIDDVIVDGVTAYGTSEWAGIIVNGAGFDAADGQNRGEHIEIRNSVVHDVAGDGILLARVAHGVLEHNVAWYTGMQEKETIGTPNAIWEWRCKDCRVEYNEAYFTDSPGVDGGAFDIDYGDENNYLDHNFGHDSQGYCISVFGAEGMSGNSVDSQVQHNTCIHNGRSPRLSKRQGAIFLYTWNGGKLDGVEIANNTIVWDPAVRVPAIQSTAEFSGNHANRFRDNTVISVSRSFVSSSAGVQFSGNHYCAPDLAAASSTTESDPAANKPDEMCGCLTELLRKTAVPDPNVASARPMVFAPGGHWKLVSLLAAPGDRVAGDSGAAASRSQMVLIESMMRQFGSLGLESVVVPEHAIAQDALEQWRVDWNIDSAVEIDATDAIGLRKFLNSPKAPLLLVSQAGQVAANWQYPTAPADVWLQIESHLGAPAGAQQMPACQNSMEAR